MIFAGHNAVHDCARVNFARASGWICGSFESVHLSVSLSQHHPTGDLRPTDSLSQPYEKYQFTIVSPRRARCGRSRGSTDAAGCPMALQEVEERAFYLGMTQLPPTNDPGGYIMSRRTYGRAGDSRHLVYILPRQQVCTGMLLLQRAMSALRKSYQFSRWRMTISARRKETQRKRRVAERGPGKAEDANSRGRYQVDIQPERGSVNLSHGVPYLPTEGKESYGWLGGECVYSLT